MRKFLSYAVACTLLVGAAFTAEQSAEAGHCGGGLFAKLKAHRACAGDAGHSGCGLLSKLAAKHSCGGAPVLAKHHGGGGLFAKLFAKKHGCSAPAADACCEAAPAPAPCCEPAPAPAPAPCCAACAL